MSDSNPAPEKGPVSGQGAADSKARRERKHLWGIVMSNKMDKTLVVQVNRKVRHPVYEKFVSRKTKYYAHDEKGEANVGDTVEIAQTRPMSKLKRWRLLRIVQKASL